MKNIGIRHIENRKFQILDGTEKICRVLYQG